jgi:serine/threonine protein kinase
VLPFCNGGELFSVVESGGAMDEAQCRHWFSQVLAGLSYLQSRFICHRDMSLENVLLDGNISKVSALYNANLMMDREVTWRITLADYRFRLGDWHPGRCAWHDLLAAACWRRGQDLLHAPRGKTRFIDPPGRLGHNTDLPAL